MEKNCETVSTADPNESYNLAQVFEPESEFVLTQDKKPITTEEAGDKDQAHKKTRKKNNIK